MASATALSLGEELLLLALRDKKGTITAGSLIDYGLGGALLAELLMGGRVACAPGRRKLLNVSDARPLGDALADECLRKVTEAKRRADLKTWVMRFAHMKKLRHRVAGELCRRGVLRADEDKILLIFTRKIYPEVDPRPEREIIERLRRAIFSDAPDVDPRTVVLISLAESIGALKPLFGGKELRGRKARLKQLAAGEIAGKAAREAIEAMQTAVFVACILPAIIASTAGR